VGDWRISWPGWNECWNSILVIAKESDFFGMARDTAGAEEVLGEFWWRQWVELWSIWRTKFYECMFAEIMCNHVFLFTLFAATSFFSDAVQMYICKSKCGNAFCGGL
jgi:hypothetical protein